MTEQPRELGHQHRAAGGLTPAFALAHCAISGVSDFFRAVKTCGLLTQPPSIGRQKTTVITTTSCSVLLTVVSQNHQLTRNALQLEVMRLPLTYTGNLTISKCGKDTKADQKQKIKRTKKEKMERGVRLEKHARRAAYFYIERFGSTLLALKPWDDPKKINIIIFILNKVTEIPRLCKESQKNLVKDTLRKLLLQVDQRALAGASPRCTNQLLSAHLPGAAWYHPLLPTREALEGCAAWGHNTGQGQNEVAVRGTPSEFPVFGKLSLNSTGQCERDSLTGYLTSGQTQWLTMSQRLVHLYIIYLQFLEAVTLSVNLRWWKVNHGSCSIYAKTASDRLRPQEKDEEEQKKKEGKQMRGDVTQAGNSLGKNIANGSDDGPLGEMWIPRRQTAKPSFQDSGSGRAPQAIVGAGSKIRRMPQGFLVTKRSA
ncbi:hypothetical protein JEQ12_019219 [Ovis aries]|uniref:Uncharacterized protein n=1 Tax=Ovis aries TaxID=9940 RepID=A0A836AAP6_SHEEP|nr:hypothetical protein JEQ12_019219 [Ovis aries]